jgi:hypothetical protein
VDQPLTDAEWAWGSPGRGGELDGCIMHRVPTSIIRKLLECTCRKWARMTHLGS